MAESMGGIGGGAGGGPSQRDVGPAALESIVRGLGGDDDRWITRRPRSIRWQHGECSTAIEALPALDAQEIRVAPVAVSTTIGHLAFDGDRRDASEADLDHAISEQNGRPLLEAVVREPQSDELMLRTTVMLHEGNLEWGWKLLQSAAGLHAVRSYRVAREVRRALSARSSAATLEPVIAEHGTQGPRLDRDELTQLDERLFLPLGTARAEYANEELDDCRPLFSLFSSVARRSETLEAKLDGVGRGASIRVTTGTPHPWLGHGLGCELTVAAGRASEPTRQASLLNLLEHTGLPDGMQALGAWSAQGESVVHRTFVPRAVQMRGLAQNLLLGSVVRGRWLATTGVV